MKKFMKGCAIIALILLVLGFTLAFVAGSIEGTNKLNEIVESVTGGKVHINLGNGWDSWGIFVDENEWEEPEVLFDINESTMFDNDFEIYESNVDKYSVGDNVAKLDIEVGGCALYFEQSGDNNFYVEATDVGRFQCFIKSDTLYVKSSKTTVNDWDEFDDGKIILYIPSDYEFEKVDAELGAGLLEMGVVVSSETNLEVGAGQITVKYLQADKCDIEVGMGEIIVDDMQVTKLDAEVGMGHLQMDGTILGDVNAECSMGVIEFDLTGSEEEFNYKLEAAMGNVSIDGKDYSGLSQDKTVKNSANKNMNIECAMGNIEVNFED